MTDAATLLPDTAARAVRDAGYAERQLAMLGRLAEAGLEIAIALEAQAKGGPVVVEGDVAMAYSRVARAVRQTLMLQSKLIEAQRGRDRDDAARKAAARSSAARILRGAIDEDRANDAERTERLSAEAAQRLEREDFADLQGRPFGEIVAGICRDLGLSPDWLRLAQDCLAAETGWASGTTAEAPEADDLGPWPDPAAPWREKSWYERRTGRPKPSDSG